MILKKHFVENYPILYRSIIKPIKFRFQDFICHILKVYCNMVLSQGQFNRIKEKKCWSSKNSKNKNTLIKKVEKKKRRAVESAIYSLEVLKHKYKGVE